MNELLVSALRLPSPLVATWYSVNIGTAPTESAALATIPTYAPAGLFQVVQSPLPAFTRYSSQMSGFRACDMIPEIPLLLPWPPRPTNRRLGLPSLAASFAAEPVPVVAPPPVPLPPVLEPLRVTVAFAGVPGLPQT